MPKIDREQKIRIAAYLRGKHLTEAQIAFRLGEISTAQVFRLLKEAKAAGLIEVQIVYTGERELSPDDDAALRTLTFQAELQALVAERIRDAGPHKPPEIYLYDLRDVRADGDTAAAVRTRMRVFAERAAPELRRLLTRPCVKVIGVAWGGGLSAIVDALAAQSFPSRSDNPVTVVATCGEPLDRRPTNESSAAIAESFSLAFNGSREHAKTLGITPAYIPASEPAVRDVIWRHIVATPPYLEVLGAARIPSAAGPYLTPPAPPLCDAMDAFVTGVSTEGRTLGYGAYQIVKPEFLDPKLIASLMFGDIGGIPLPRPNLAPEQVQALRDYESNWTGITQRHVQACVAKGFTGRHPVARTPGCVLIAVGERKARAVYQAVVVEGLVNHLFIDDACAKALDALLAQPSA